MYYRNDILLILRTFRKDRKYLNSRFFKSFSNDLTDEINSDSCVVEFLLPK